MTDTVRILLIEDEPQMRRFLRASLATTSHIELLEAESGHEGLALAAEKHPDVILLDLGLPDIDGIEVTKRLREWTKTPIVVLSARYQDQDKVAVLDAGADDYLTKPFSLPELLVRIRVARRHAGQETIVMVGNVCIDLTSRVVTRAGAEVKLTQLEYNLLAALARNLGRVMTYEQLLKEVWGPNYVRQRQYLHVYVSHLRTKLEDNPSRPLYLVTEAGVGYRLKGESLSAAPT